MSLFYTPDIPSNASQYVLNAQESKHCTRVLRLQEGAEIQLIDGKGGFYTADIIAVHKNQVVVQIKENTQNFGKRDFQIHIAIAPTKNMDRLEWFLEKATEIGIDKITPIICDRSERKEVKIERLEKVITAAVKQSIKAYHPQIEEATAFKKFIQQDFSSYQRMLIAHCVAGTKEFIQHKVKALENVLVLIGPEGDFSPNEILLAKEKGFTEIGLGSARLRTETAALFACFQLNQLNM